MRRLPATTAFYGMELLLSMPTFIVVAVYLVRDLHLSPLQLVLMGTAMEATVFLSEVPTGVVADTYGRRLSLIIGLLGTGTAWLLVGLVSAPWLVIGLWAFWGFAHTFQSGAYEAWITDEVGVDRVGPVFLRGARFSYVGSILGLVALVALGTQSIRAAVIAGGAIEIACAIALIFLMPETGFRRRPVAERKGPLQELRMTAATAARYVRAAPLLLMIIGIAVFAGASSEAFDRLKEAHFLRDVGLPSIGHFPAVVWFGAIAVVAMLFGFFAIGALQKRFERAGTGRVAKLLFTFTALLAGSQLLFALTGSPVLAIGAVLGVLIAREVMWPLWITWVNQQITDSSVRATVLSMTGQADAIGEAAVGPVLGVIANAYGISSGLAVGALLLLPALGLYARALRHGGREPELQELAAPAA
ncbi:MAG TPA: MFS transporter [Gaiellaceae bacterium]|nr:MFS transporter [Gaiellaceae bacterium]